MIDVRDGQPDTVACGAGRDTVKADRRDEVAGDCEVVRRPAVVAQVIEHARAAFAEHGSVRFASAG